MAINFPNSPTNGDIFGNFTYDTSIPGWRKNPENAASLPAGTIVQWPRATAPANWLLCQGQAVSRTTYASLFAAIGVQFGSGDGTTTFNLPDLRGRTAVGLDSSQTEFNILSKTGGAKTHTLSSSEMPSHTHTGSATTGSSGSHTHTVTVGGGAHTHQLPMAASGAPSNTGDTPYRASGGADGNFRTGFEASGSGYGSSTGTHTHTTSVSTDGAHTHSVSFTTDSAGTGGAHNNLQPYIVLNYIIKTSAGITSGDSELATRVGVVEAQNNATPLSQNYIINGGFDIWQRGTSITNCAEGVYLADRWAPNEYQTNRVSRVSVTSGQGPVSQYAIRSASRGSASRQVVYQKIESVNSIPLRGKTVTLSFWMRASSATWASSGTPYGGFRYSIGYNTTTTDAAIGQAGGGFDSLDSVLIADGSLPTSWTRYSVTGVVPLTANNIAVRFGMNADGTAVADTNWFEVTDVQLEMGSYATPFRRNAPSIQAELAACQRYFIRYSAPAGYYDLVQGFQINTTRAAAYVPLPVPMRVWPSVSAFSAGLNWSDDIVSNQTITALSVVGNAGMVGNVVKLYADWSASFGSAARPGVLRSAVGAGSFDLSAEL